RPIGVRFSGRVFLIDTGMLAEVYGGKPSALEIDRGVFTAIYVGKREELWNDSRETRVATEGVATPQAGAAESPTEAAAAATPAPAKPPAKARAKAAPWKWTGPEGEPLPSRGPEKLEDFLRTAEVKKSETIESGINRPLKVTLERDGVEAHAGFRTVSGDQHNQGGPGGKFYRNFRDSYQFECAAYELARTLGIERVPPAIPRTYQ